MRRRFQRKIFKSIFWRRFYWRLKLVELIVSKWMVFYYSLFIKVTSPVMGWNYSVEYLFICLAKTTVLSILIIVLISRIIAIVRRFNIIQNLMYFFKVFLSSVVDQVFVILNEFKVSFALVRSWLTAKFTKNIFFKLDLSTYFKYIFYKIYLKGSVSNSLEFRLIKKYFILLNIYSGLISSLGIQVVGYKPLNNFFYFLKPVYKNTVYNYYWGSMYVPLLIKRWFRLYCARLYLANRVKNKKIIFYRYNIFFYIFLVLSPLNNNSNLRFKTIIEKCYYLVLLVFLNYIFTPGLIFGHSGLSAYFIW